MDKKALIEEENRKNEYFELDKSYQKEKACLVKVLNAFGLILDTVPKFREDYQAIKGLIHPDKALPLDRIEKEIASLKDKIYSEEIKTGIPDRGSDDIDVLRRRLTEAHQAIKRVVMPFLDGFYPLPPYLKKKADAVSSSWSEGEVDPEAVKSAFLEYAVALKAKISNDFKEITDTFFTLFQQVKELEKTLSGEFDGHHLKEFEELETTVNHEVGSITNAFDLPVTLEEIKSTVIRKLSNIKDLMTKKKEEERKRDEEAQKRIDALKDRITQVERNAVEMSRKAEEFKTAARLDGLTGLFNRKALDLRLQESLAALNKGGPQFSLILFDVDRFKQINDTFGHVAGDKVLKIVARCLQEAFRKGDFIARYGGDEFAVVVEGMSESMAGERIKKFRENFRKKRFFSYRDGNIKVEVSAGITLSEQGESPEELIHRADQDMYAAKRRGQALR